MQSLPLAEIFVEGLSIVCIIGDLPQERTEPQEIILDLIASVDITKVSVSDDLVDSVNYVAMAELASEIAQRGKFHLVETLVVSIGRGILKKWPSIQAIQIRVKKVGCIPSAKFCGVQIKLQQTSV